VFSLSGKVALVTGASRGLGWAMAKSLAQAGATVLINGRDAATLAPRAEELVKAGLRGEVAAFDVTDEKASAACITGAQSSKPATSGACSTPI
jgi:gluconate 5-dehydrogenase